MIKENFDELFMEMYATLRLKEEETDYYELQTFINFAHTCSPQCYNGCLAYSLRMYQSSKIHRLKEKYKQYIRADK